MDGKKFKAIYKKVDDKEAGYIEIPFDVEKEYGAKRVKVKALLDGVEYRGSLVRMGTTCHILGIPKVTRELIGKTFGQELEVELFKDEQERTVELDETFAAQLAANGAAQQFYNTLSFSNKRRYALWVDGAKRAETKNARITEAVLKLARGEVIK